MTIARHVARFSQVVMLSATALIAGVASTSAQGVKPADIVLAPHRAVYDLKLASSRGRRPIEAVRGRILYDFTGSRCEGYALQFRHVAELRVGEGQSLFTDLRAATWEDGSGKSFRFNSQNYMNQKLEDTVDGKAERRSAGINVRLSKPSGKSLTLDRTFIFPFEHMRRILEAARDGKTLLAVPVYDGSETGEKMYDTLTVIGQPIAPDADKPADAAGREPVLSKLTRWPVRISYFDKGKGKTESGEQTPIYAIGFELYENGISRGLSLDYNDFVISGEITSLEMRKAQPCG